MRCRSVFRLLTPVLFLSLAALAAAVATAQSVDGRVRLNSVGFTPGATKIATVAAPSATSFRVLRTSDDTVVLESTLSAEKQTAAGDTNETIRTADFSALAAGGEYLLEVPGVGRSAPFLIAEDVWTEPFRLVTRGLYLWRCGTAVSGQWEGKTFEHAACHLADGWLDYVGGGHVQRDGTGGWHDAGDYNKYVVNAGVSVGLIFKAWEHFRDRVQHHRLDLPESGNGVPDLLNEVRWELEWLLKMQAEDGRVYHKLSARDFGYWGVPQLDPSPRYFVPWGSTATADFAAMMAMAARHFAEFDPTFANRCLEAARRAWGILKTNPTNVAPNQTGFSTGGYDVDDAVHRLWAAAELWSTTRETEFLQEFEQRAATREFTNQGPSWGDVRDLGLATYLETESPARNAGLVQRLRTSVLTQADNVVATVNTHGYGRGLGSGNWYWGANGSVAAQTFLLHVADRLAPDPRYRRAAEQTLGFLFGRNYHNRSYVTGLGHQPPEHPHDRRGEPAWPGYLVGGGWPTGRSWKDEQADYEQNEIALNWNASLIYALAAFATPAPIATSTDWAIFTVGQSGSFTPPFVSEQVTTFSATGLPAWAQLNSATGSISGTPTDDQATAEDESRQHSTVEVNAHDGPTLAETRTVKLMIARPGNDLRIANLSARANVGTAQDILIAGFIVSGSAPRILLVRGVGPTLREHSVTSALNDARLAVYAGSELRSENNDWGTSSAVGDVRATSARLGAFPLPETSKDAALLASVAAGNYSAHVSGTAGATGVGLVEIYDDAALGGDGRLENISVRARVSGGESVVISGIILQGGGAARILVRAVGPTLRDHQVSDPLADPVLHVYAGQTLLATNDNWDGPQAEAITAANGLVGAFALSPGSRDAALIASLVEGSFSLIVESKTGSAGVALLELYVLP